MKPHPLTGPLLERALGLVRLLADSSHSCVLCGHSGAEQKADAQTRSLNRRLGLPEEVDDNPLLHTAFLAIRRYAETHLRPRQVTRWQAAEMLGVSSRTVSRYIKAGSLKLNTSGYLPIPEIDAILA